MQKVVLILLVLALVAGYAFYQKQNPTSIKQPANITITAPDRGYGGQSQDNIKSIPSLENCSVDTHLCNLFTTINSSINQENFSNLTKYQKLREKVCGGLYANICEGVKDGDIRSGYVLGAQDTEFNIFNSAEYAQKLAEYFQREKPLSYKVAVATNNQAEMIYSNNSETFCLFFKIIKENDQWLIESTIVGTSCTPYLKS